MLPIRHEIVISEIYTDSVLKAKNDLAYGATCLDIQ